MATSNELFGTLKPSEEFVVRVLPNGRGMFLFRRPIPPAGATAPQMQGAQGGTTPTVYTSAATLATALQNALPTLET